MIKENNVFDEEIKYIDEQLLAEYDAKNEDEMVKLATSFSVRSGDRLHKEWFQFYGELFARLRDFYLIEEDQDDPICNCKVGEAGFSEEWAQKIVDETADKYKCVDDDSVPDMSAVALRGFEDHSKRQRLGINKVNLAAM